MTTKQAPRSKNVPLLTEVHTMVREYSEETGISIRRIVQDAIVKHLESEKSKQE